MLKKEKKIKIFSTMYKNTFFEEVDKFFYDLSCGMVESNFNYFKTKSLNKYIKLFENYTIAQADNLSQEYENYYHSLNNEKISSIKDEDYTKLKINGMSALLYMGNNNGYSELFKRMVLSLSSTSLIKVLSKEERTSLLCCKTVLEDIEILEHLIKEGLSLNERNNKGHSVAEDLLHANEDNVIYCLNKGFIDVNDIQVTVSLKTNQYSVNGFSYAFVQCYSKLKNNKIILEKMLENNWDINNVPSGVFYLNAALNAKEFEMSNFLIGKGADIYCINNAGSNILYPNIEEDIFFANFIDYVNENKNKFVNYKNFYQVSAFNLAISDGRNKIVEWLLENGEKVDVIKVMGSIFDNLNVGAFQLLKKHRYEDMLKSFDDLHTFCQSHIEKVKQKKYYSNTKKEGSVLLQIEIEKFFLEDSSSVSYSINKKAKRL